jgi:hypothetical protein
VLSVLCWQSDVVDYQSLLQSSIIGIITYFIIKIILRSRSQTQASAIFSQNGEWLEINKDEQVSWTITNKSRISRFLLFIHLISPVNVRQSKWSLVYIDQVTERDFRRLCRAIIFKQKQ